MKTPHPFAPLGASRLFARGFMEAARSPVPERYAACGSNVAVTASASLNTKGSWVALDAATDIDADGFWLSAWGEAGNEYLLDISTGGSGAEDSSIILANLQVSARGGVFQPRHGGIVYVPIPIKIGTRISARVQSIVASGVARVSMTLCRGDVFYAQSLRTAYTMGADTSDSSGLVVDPGASAGTKGSWVTFDASSDMEVRYLIVCIGQRNNAGQIGQVGQVDVSWGSARNIVIPDICYFTSQDETIGPIWQGRHVRIPKGQEIAVRASTSTNDATDRLIDVVLVGIGA